METTKPVAIDPPRSAPALSPWAGLALGLLAAAVTYGAIQATYPIFLVDKKFDIPNIGAPIELHQRFEREKNKMDARHGMFYIGGLGLLLALTLGTGEAMARRSWITPLRAAPLGVLGGAVGGYLGTLVQVYVRTNYGQAELNHTIGTQVALGLPLGLGVGLGLGLATRSIAGTLKAAFAGLAAGALAASLYAVLVSVLLPAASTDTLIPDQPSSRALWLALFGGLLGALIPVASRGRNKPSAA
jgi:hypothetical protein